MSPLEKKETGSQGSEEQTQETNTDLNQPTDIEGKVVVDPKYIESLEARIAEQQIRNRSLESLIENSRRERDEDDSRNVQPRNIEKEREGFFVDPVGTLNQRLEDRDSKILKQMKEMLAPLQEVASSFRVNSEYEKIKNTLKVDPLFGPALKDPDVESMVDNIIRQPGVTLDENTVKSAITQVYGLKSMGGLRGSSASKREDPSPRNRIDPPVIEPTRTRLQAPQERKELTEDDRLAMKLARLTPGNPEHEKEYWNLISKETMVLETHKKNK